MRYLEKGEFLLVDEKAIYIFNLLQFGEEDSGHKSYEDFEINLTIQPIFKLYHFS